jgi:hypothetical protein
MTIFTGPLSAATSAVSVKALIEHALCDWMEVSGAIRLEDAVAKGDKRALQTMAERIHALDWKSGSLPGLSLRRPFANSNSRWA